MLKYPVPVLTLKLWGQEQERGGRTEERRVYTSSSESTGENRSTNRSEASGISQVAIGNKRESAGKVSQYSWHVSRTPMLHYFPCSEVLLQEIIFPPSKENKKSNVGLFIICRCSFLGFVLFCFVFCNLKSMRMIQTLNHESEQSWRSSYRLLILYSLAFCSSKTLPWKASAI